MTLRPTPPDGLIDGTRHLYAVRVYYEDTDLSQVAYHANYLRWFERARSDLLRRLDIDQRAAVESGEGAYAVADLSIRYLRPARLDDDIVIETQCTQLRAASCRMHQRAARRRAAGRGRPEGRLRRPRRPAPAPAARVAGSFQVPPLQRRRTAMILSQLAAAAPNRLDPVQLFLDADIVVQLVMVGLLAASIWTWMIIVSFSMRMAGVRRRADAFEADFWRTDDFDGFMQQHAKRNVPIARIAGAGMAEWRRSTKGGVKDREGLRGRVALAMEGQVAEEADDLARRLNFLATVGSVAPFVGLFGTVWGIMNSFFQIGAQESSSLAVVAPAFRRRFSPPRSASSRRSRRSSPITASATR